MVSYTDLMAAKPDQFSAAARALGPALTALAHAEKVFTRQVVQPLSTWQDWNSQAAGHAHTTAQVHQHGMSVTHQELTAAQRALRLYADDMGSLKAALKSAVATAVAAGVIVHDDGTSSLNTRVMTGNDGYNPDPVPPSPDKVAPLYQAQRTYENQCNAILKLATEIDGGAADILHKIADGSSDLIIAGDNTVPNVNWNRTPENLDKVELELNVPPENAPGTNPILDTEAQLASIMGSSADGGENIRESLKNVRKFLTEQGDPKVKEAATKFIDKYGRFEPAERTLKYAKTAGPFLDLALNVAKYSEQTHSVVEISVKSGVATLTSAGGSLIGGGIANAFCFAVNTDDFELGFGGCRIAAAILGSYLGGMGGGKLGDVINGRLYRKTGDLPDPFLIDYSTKHHD